MSSDSWLSKNIRPLSLAFLTITLFIYVILDSSLDTFKIDSEWISLLGNLLMLVYGGYFGARTLRKDTSEVKDYFFNNILLKKKLNILTLNSSISFFITICL